MYVVCSICCNHTTLPKLDEVEDEVNFTLWGLLALIGNFRINLSDNIAFYFINDSEHF